MSPSLSLRRVLHFNGESCHSMEPRRICGAQLCEYMRVYIFRREKKEHCAAYMFASLILYERRTHTHTHLSELIQCNAMLCTHSMLNKMYKLLGHEVEKRAHEKIRASVVRPKIPIEVVL